NGSAVFPAGLRRDVVRARRQTVAAGSILVILAAGTAPDPLIRSVPPVHDQVALFRGRARRDVGRVDGHAFVREDVNDAVLVRIRVYPEAVDDGRARQIGRCDRRVHLHSRPEGAGVGYRRRGRRACRRALGRPRRRRGVAPGRDCDHDCNGYTNETAHVSPFLSARRADGWTVNGGGRLGRTREGRSRGPDSDPIPGCPRSSVNGERDGLVEGGPSDKSSAGGDGAGPGEETLDRESERRRIEYGKGREVEERGFAYGQVAITQLEGLEGSVRAHARGPFPSRHDLDLDRDRAAGRAV